MNESKAVALSVVVAVAGAIILIFATSGVVQAPRALPAEAADDRSVSHTAPPSRPARVGPTAQPTPTLVPAFRPALFEPPPPRPTPAPTFVASTVAPTPAPATPTPTPPPPTPEPNDPELQLPAAPDNDIRTVDFATGFPYPVGDAGPVIVDDGHGVVGEAGTDGYAAVDVLDVAYGDVNGDGVDDAAVVLNLQVRTWDPLTEIQVFTIEDGRVAFAGATWFEADSVRSTRIVDGLLQVEAWDHTFERLSTTTFAIHGDGLQQLEESAHRIWIDASQGSEGQVHTVPGQGSHALRVAVAADRSSSIQTLSFATEGPWMAQLSPETGHGATVRLWEASGRLVGDLRAGSPVQLPGAGSYLGEIRFEEDATTDVVFELDVAEHRTLLSPTWQPRLSRTVVEGPGLRVASATWPVFDLHSSFGSEQALNAIVGDFIGKLQDEHSAVIATCAEDQGTNQSISYRPTLVSYDLVALDFTEYSAACDGSGESRQHTMIVDLNTGRQLDVDDIVALDAAELPVLWWDSLLAQSYWSFDDADVYATEVAFVTATLHPHGVTITAEVTGLPNGPITLSASLSFEDLGGLVRPGIAVRAASGAGAPYPIEDRCGC